MKLIHKIICIAILLLFQLTQSFGQEPEKSSTPRTIPELKTAIEEVLEETQTPAVGLALVHGDSAVWMAGLGKANIENDVAANENTMFRIGSVSKMYVSLAILKLQQEGLVSLKDKVRDLVPEIEFKNPWDETSPILVEHLLEHTTGWDDIHLTEYALNDPELSLKEGLDFHPQSRTSRWVPGTRMAYCNSGPPVAAYIVEKITGQAFEDYIQENFFEPMGMENMTYFESEDYRQYGATLYIDGKPQDYWHIIMRPSGSINASPNDMAKMVRFFINKGRVDSLQLISEESLKRMETPATTIGARAGLEYGYGLSNYSLPHKGFVYRTHQGGVNGGLTEFSYLPDYNVGYAFMINSGNGEALGRIADLVRDFQIKDLEGKKVNGNPLAETEEVDISGYYVTLNPRNQMFYFLERILNVQRMGQKENSIFRKGLLGGDVENYLPENETHFLSPLTGKISMVQAQDPLAGKVIQASNQVLKRVSPLLVFGQLILVGVWLLGMISSILLGTIWVIRYWTRKIQGGANIKVRLWPLIASLSFLVIVVTLIIGVSDPFELLGKVSLISLSLSILTICFALLSVWSVFYIIRERHANVNRIAYWHSAILASLHLIVTCYLLWYNVIGIQTWN